MSRYLKRFCVRRAHKVSLFLYQTTMRVVSPAKKRWIAARLLKSALGASEDEMINDRIHAEENAILEQYKFKSVKMWKFCGSAVLRLCTQSGLKGKIVRFDEVSVMQKHLFKSVRTAQNDGEVNAKVAAFFEQTLGK